MSADDVAAAARYYRRQAKVDQRLVNRAAAAGRPAEDLERRRDLWAQLAQEAEAYLALAEEAELEFTPPLF